MRRIKNLPIITIILVSINVIVFFADFFSGYKLSYYGGVQKTAIMNFHEYGRLVWAMFLHANTGHLFNNMIILIFLGAMLEAEVGHVAFPIVYMASGIGGNVMSLMLKIKQRNTALSIGASGAVFGLDGLLLALVLADPDFRDRIPPVRVMVMIALSLYEGYRSYNVDNAAHFGGLVVGFLLGLVLVNIKEIKKKHREVRF